MHRLDGGGQEDGDTGCLGRTLDIASELRDISRFLALLANPAGPRIKVPSALVLFLCLHLSSSFKLDLYCPQLFSLPKWNPQKILSVLPSKCIHSLPAWSKPPRSLAWTTAAACFCLEVSPPHLGGEGEAYLTASYIMSFQALWWLLLAQRQDPAQSSPASPLPRLARHSLCSTLAPSLFLGTIRHTPTSGPLHSLFPVSGMILP